MSESAAHPAFAGRCSRATARSRRRRPARPARDRRARPRVLHPPAVPRPRCGAATRRARRRRPAAGTRPAPRPRGRMRRRGARRRSARVARRGPPAARRLRRDGDAGLAASRGGVEGGSDPPGRDRNRPRRHSVPARGRLDVLEPARRTGPGARLRHLHGDRAAAARARDRFVRPPVRRRGRDPWAVPLLRGTAAADRHCRCARRALSGLGRPRQHRLLRRHGRVRGPAPLPGHLPRLFGVGAERRPARISPWPAARRVRRHLRRRPRSDLPCVPLAASAAGDARVRFRFASAKARPAMRSSVCSSRRRPRSRSPARTGYGTGSTEPRRDGP